MSPCRRLVAPITTAAGRCSASMSHPPTSVLQARPERPPRRRRGAADPAVRRRPRCGSTARSTATARPCGNWWTASRASTSSPRAPASRADPKARTWPISRPRVAVALDDRARTRRVDGSRRRRRCGHVVRLLPQRARAAWNAATAGKVHAAHRRRALARSRRHVGRPRADPRSATGHVRVRHDEPLLPRRRRRSQRDARSRSPVSLHVLLGVPRRPVGPGRRDGPHGVGRPRCAAPGALDVWSQVWSRQPRCPTSTTTTVTATWVYPVGTPLFPTTRSWHDPEGVADAYWGPAVHWNTYLNQYVMLLNRTQRRAASRRRASTSRSARRSTSPTVVRAAADPARADRGIRRSWGSGLATPTSRPGQVARFFLSGSSSYFIEFQR